MRTKFFILCLSFAFISCTDTSDVKYKSDQGYSFTYSDEEWAMQKEDEGIILFPRDEEETEFMSSVNIIVQDFSHQPMTLEDYHELTLTYMHQAIGFSTIESEKDITVSNIPAKELIFTTPGDEEESVSDIKFKQVYLLKNNKAYVITYTSKIDEFDNHLSSANTIFDTFKVEE